MHLAGVDAESEVVDNYGPPEAREAGFGGSQKKMSTMSLNLWQSVCERLASELPEQQFRQLGREAFAGALPQVWAHCGHLLVGAAGPGFPRSRRTAVIHNLARTVNPRRIAAVGMQVFDR